MRPIYLTTVFNPTHCDELQIPVNIESLPTACYILLSILTGAVWKTPARKKMTLERHLD